MNNFDYTLYTRGKAGSQVINVNHVYVRPVYEESAFHVAKRILHCIDFLSTQPQIGKQGRVARTRELIISNTPFIIPYRVKNNVIEILRVLHGAMQKKHARNEVEQVRKLSV